MILEDFSAGYYLATDTQVETYPGDRAVVAEDTYRELQKALWPPFYGTVGGVHFEIHPEQSVPANFVAVPEDRRYHAHRDDVLLVSKHGNPAGRSEIQR